MQMVRIILTPFKPLIRLLGADFNQLCLILGIKLKMDNRRSMSLSHKKKESNSQLWLQGFIYAVIGGFMGAMVAFIDSPLAGNTIFFSFLMIMIAMLMISEFTNVLIDTRDNSILMPRPVNSRTLTLAKILHIAFYMLHLSLSLSIFHIFSTLLSHGWTAMFSLLALILLTALFTLFLTNIFYLGLMNVVSGQKLKDIIVYFQIAIAILFMGGYQIMPRIMETNQLAEMTLTIHWWSYFIPPIWMAGSLDAIITNLFDSSHIIFASLALLIPILSLVFVVKVLAPRFNKALGQLEVASTKKDKQKRVEKVKPKTYSHTMSKLFTTNKEESTAFRMVWLMSGRERKYKQTVFPAFGYIFILIFAFAFKDKESFDLVKLASSKIYLWFVYIPIFLSFAATQNLCYSDQNKSSWFYQALPLKSPGNILLGSFKSVMVKYFLPAYLFITIACTAFWGIKVIDDFIYGFLCICLVSSLFQSWQDRTLPFSQERETLDMGGNFAKGMLLMFASGIAGALHYGLSFIPYSTLIGIPLFALLLYFNFKSYQKISWKKITS